MKIIKPSVEIIDDLNAGTIYKKLERASRVCYKSEGSTTEDSAPKFLANIIKRGHESVLEHQSITVKFICDRGGTHEMVRHRIASYSQESTRYANYSNDKFGNEITVIEPCFWNKNTDEYELWEKACEEAEWAYMQMLSDGATPQEARSVLPNSLKAEIFMTANIREWRHFLKLRTSPASHPQIVEISKMLLEQFNEILPVLFNDIS